MSGILPTHRGQVSNMTHRGAGTGSFGSSSGGGRDQKIEDVNRSLLEQENDRKWVRSAQRVYVRVLIRLI
jgi:hypothetical protein